jgi:hypothetical protein
MPKPAQYYLAQYSGNGRIKVAGTTYLQLPVYRSHSPEYLEV